MSARAKGARSIATGYQMPRAWVDDHLRVTRNRRARETLAAIATRARAAQVSDLDQVTITLPIDEDAPTRRRRKRLAA